VVSNSAGVSNKGFRRNPLEFLTIRRNFVTFRRNFRQSAGISGNSPELAYLQHNLFRLPAFDAEAAAGSAGGRASRRQAVAANMLVETYLSNGEVTPANEYSIRRQFLKELAQLGPPVHPCTGGRDQRGRKVPGSAT